MQRQSSPDFVGTEVEWVLEVRVWWQSVHHLLCPCWRFGGLPPDHGLSLHWWFWRYSWYATPKCKPLIELAWCPGSKSNFLRSRTFHTKRLGALYRALISKDGRRRSETYMYKLCRLAGAAERHWRRMKIKNRRAFGGNCQTFRWENSSTSTHLRPGNQRKGQAARHCLKIFEEQVCHCFFSWKWRYGII